jgi:hypothetical protein
MEKPWGSESHSPKTGHIACTSHDVIWLHVVPPPAAFLAPRPTSSCTSTSWSSESEPARRIDAILLYGSKTRNLTASALARLEGFHICLAYKMAREHQPRQGANHVWTYPRLADVLEECGVWTIAEYICKQRDTIAVYVATRPILEACRVGEWQRGSMPRQWWWEQPMNFG